VPSRGNELPSVFLKSSPWPEPLHENILQAGQHFRYSSPSELLQGGRDTWPKFAGQVEILHRRKWKKELQPQGVIDDIILSI